MKKALLMMLAAGLVVGLAGFGTAADDKAPKAKYTVKQIMKQAHGKGLLKKVVSGKASDKDKLKLLDLYISLLENKPKKGSAASWAKLSGSLVYATARVAAGRDGSIGMLKKASSCGGCHKAHK